jgi:dihydroorotase (multifunctional complex type)
MSEKFDLVVRGGTVVNARTRARLDVYVRDGKIAALMPQERAGEFEADEVIDAGGMLVLPGMVDTHVHFMDPGDTSREDFPTGTAAAATAGVTTVVEHTHAWPVTTVARMREKLDHLSGRAHVDYSLAAHVWPEHMDELPGLWREGIAYFKAFTCETHGVPAIDADLLFKLADALAPLVAPCLVHCEDDLITARNEARLREALRRDGGIVPEWRSREAELVATSAVAMIARLRQVRFLVAHASSADVLDLLARERALGSPVLAESCPQYMHLREDEVLDEGAFRKFTPPARIRSNDDEQRMWAAFESGLVHHLSTDHAPATAAQKRDGDVWDVHFGLPGIDTTFPVMLSAALSGRTSVERIVQTYSANPARVYGFGSKGALAEGYDADFVVVDPSASWTLTDDAIVSKAGWTPYAGMELRGRVLTTALRGRVIVRDSRLVEGDRGGRFLPGAGREAA